MPCNISRTIGSAVGAAWPCSVWWRAIATTRRRTVATLRFPASSARSTRRSAASPAALRGHSLRNNARNRGDRSRRRAGLRSSVRCARILWRVRCRGRRRPGGGRRRALRRWRAVDRRERLVPRIDGSHPAAAIVGKRFRILLQTERFAST